MTSHHKAVLFFISKKVTFLKFFVTGLLLHFFVFLCIIIL